jgi:hypothetical protein
MIDRDRLDTFEFDEFFDVARKLKPGITREELQVMWDDHCDKREAGTLPGQQVLQ